MLIGIIQSFLNAVGMILGKKVVENKAVSNNWQTFFARGLHIIVVIFLFIFGILDNNLNSSILTFNDYLLLIGSTLALYVTYPLRRNAYANEKVSVLQPFAMLFHVFPIIIGFIFIATERANLITFLTALLASFVVILGNIDFKNFKISKYSLMVLTSSIIKSFQIFASLYFLTKLNPASFYMLETIVVLTISIFLIFLKKEISQIKLITKTYAKLMFFTNIIVIGSILLSLTMFSTLGVVATSLLSLLYLVFIYILGYFILKDIPSKKDILITIIVSICIIVGILFKVN